MVHSHLLVFQSCWFKFGTLCLQRKQPCILRFKKKPQTKPKVKTWTLCLVCNITTVALWNILAFWCSFPVIQRTPWKKNSAQIISSSTSLCYCVNPADTLNLKDRADLENIQRWGRGLTQSKERLS